MAPNEAGFGDVSSCEFDVYRHDPSGWILQSPVIRFVFWGSYWQLSPDTTLEMLPWEAMLNGGTVLHRLAEYNILDPVMSDFGAFTNLQVKGQIDDATISTELNREIQLGQVDLPDANNTLYVVFLPPNVSTITLDTSKFDGYHGATKYGATRYAYAIIKYHDPNNGDDGLVSHEVYEAVTDPNGMGYYDDMHGDEVGDLCNAEHVEVDGFSVQKVWSQATCRCQ